MSTESEFNNFLKVINFKDSKYHPVLLTALLWLLLILPGCDEAQNTRIVGTESTTPKIPSQIESPVGCNFDSNPIFTQIFEQGNTESLPENEIEMWKVLDNYRLAIRTDDDMVEYIKKVIAQFKRSSKGTPFWVIGQWLSQNSGSIYLVDELPNPNAKAAFTITEDGQLAFVFPKGRLAKTFVMELATELAHEVGHAASIQNRNDFDGRLRSSDIACDEVPSLTIELSLAASFAQYARIGKLGKWMQITKTPNWWKSDEWMNAVMDHVRSNYP